MLTVTGLVYDISHGENLVKSANPYTVARSAVVCQREILERQWLYLVTTVRHLTIRF